VSPEHYIFFDVDDTLIEWNVSWVEVYAEAARLGGVDVSPAQSEQALTIAFTTFYKDCLREHSAAGEERAFWRDYDARILRSLGVTGDLAAASDYLIRVFGKTEAVSLYPEVTGVLDLLSGKGARLGIVTGRPRAEPHLGQLGVSHYFHPIIDAFSVASAKSEGHMFRVAAEAADQAGLTAWHVGDNYEDDVLGARRAGLRPVLVDRKGEHPDADCPRIDTLRELPAVLAAFDQE